jgi:aconitase A
MSSENNSAVVALYVIKNGDGQFFAGYDSNKQQANLVDNPIHAKKFTNKYDIKLRPNETMVELSVDLEKVNVTISEPFRPQRRKQAVSA